jgi:hypothetical protein
VTLGKYTVFTALRPDNPAFPVYRIFIGAKLIGKQFSVPSLTDCRWHEVSGGVYATRSTFVRTSEGRGR